MRSILTFEFVQRKVTEATARLDSQPESEVAQKMHAELPLREELIRERVQEIPILLEMRQPEGWTI